MPKPPDAVPDRLADVLHELEVARRTPGWVPSDDFIPSRSTRRRKAAIATESTSQQKSQALRIPASFRGAEVGASRRAILGVIAVVAAVLLVLGGRVLLAQASAQPHAVGPGSTGVSGAAPTHSTASTLPDTGTAVHTGAARTPSATSSAGAVVHVVGQVKHPGVYRLSPGARVEDAVTAAGGALPGADLTAVNLARIVTDGEQVHLPKPGEVVSTGAAAPGLGASSGGPGSAPSTVDLNTADEAALDGLPGVGPVLAQRILQWRATNNRFSSIDELGEVSGIGDKLLSQLRPLVRVG